MFDGMDYVYEVYLEKSFSAAAKKLFISQPALSAAVKKVEKQLGITIFDRSTNPISLTQAGRVCIESVEQMRALQHNMLNQLNDLSEMKSGNVTVSGENFISSFILPEIILRFMNTYSGINIELVESHTHDLKNQLLDEKVDILVAHDFDPELFVSYPLSDETLLLSVPVNNPINRHFADKALPDSYFATGQYLEKDCPTVDLLEFADEDFLVLKKGNDMFTRTMQLCDNAGFAPKVKIYSDQLMTAYNMSRAGLGLTIVTDNLMRAVHGTSKCCIYKISGENTKRKLSIGYKKKRYPSRAMEAFVQCAMEVYKIK
ncbi:MAG: LysR family transcriptional regulator [Oscillospiraceae bacterium]|nr:LysR family transcriptional regulator [Oscillospiraceae bacterium]